MAGAIYYFDDDKLDAAGVRYVEDGAGDAKLKALRQQEVDGALAFLRSDAARKLRVERADQSGQGLSNDAPARPLPPKEA